MSLLSANLLYGQTQTLELGQDSAAPSIVGPATSAQVTFLHNILNPNDNNLTPYYPELTATIEFTNQNQYFVSQNTNDDENDNQNPPVVIGWDFIAEGDQEAAISDGQPKDILASFLLLDESVNDPDSGSGVGVPPEDGCDEKNINPGDCSLTEGEVISYLESLYSSSEDNIGEGFSFDVNHGLFVAAGFDGLAGEIAYGENVRVRLADMTITFNQPVNNPVLHLFGPGGFWLFDDGETFYYNSATVEFDLIGSDYVLDLLSGNGGLNVENNNSIVNTRNIPSTVEDIFSDEDDTGPANGSVIIRGEGITEVSFELYVRTIRDLVAAQSAFDAIHEPVVYDVGNSDYGWAGEGDGFETYNVANDLFMISLTADVIPDETALTGDECFRMLSNPIAGTTFGEFLAPLWTQGATGSDHPESDQPNIFTWEAGSSSNPGWIEFTGDLDNTELEPWEGFLMSVFADEFGVQDPVFGTKLLSLTGSEHPTDQLDFTSSEGDVGGWILLGNPYKEPIDIPSMLLNSSGIENFVYIWDRNNTGGIVDDNLDDPETYGSWRVSNGSGASEIIDNAIAPFQGFFVQKNAQTSTVNFSNREVIVTTGGEFYGKEAVTNTLRLEVQGESLYNYMWLEFSHEGDFNKTRGDAPALTPLSTQYAMFGSQKENGEMFTIGHFPTPSEDFEIPVGFESTRAGTFTVSATDFNVSFGSDLYFIDLYNDKSIRMDENFKYEFTSNQAAAKSNSFELSCGVMEPQNAVAESAPRFMISSQPRDSQSELPQEVALRQNYPNPFNPATQITYELPQQTEVHLVVYDMLGREVATLVEGAVEAGVHSVNFDGANLSSGVYIYRLQAGNTVRSRKLTLIK